jgi:hypothetical protein
MPGQYLETGEEGYSKFFVHEIHDYLPVQSDTM